MDEDWEQQFAKSYKRGARAARLRSLMFVVIITSALGSLVVILWLVANELLHLPTR
jgi:hypothetical protein